MENRIDDIKPTFETLRSISSSSSAAWDYDQDGVSYDEAGFTYDGSVNKSDPAPQFDSIDSTRPFFETIEDTKP